MLSDNLGFLVLEMVCEVMVLLAHGSKWHASISASDCIGATLMTCFLLSSSGVRLTRRLPLLADHFWHLRNDQICTGIEEAEKADEEAERWKQGRTGGVGWRAKGKLTRREACC